MAALDKVALLNLIYPEPGSASVVVVEYLRPKPPGTPELPAGLNASDISALFDADVLPARYTTGILE